MDGFVVQSLLLCLWLCGRLVWMRGGHGDFARVFALERCLGFHSGEFLLLALGTVLVRLGLVFLLSLGSLSLKLFLLRQLLVKGVDTDQLDASLQMSLASQSRARPTFWVCSSIS